MPSCFHVVLIKPSHYDNDGYVIQWRRSTIPSNSLASVHGLLLECADAKVLGDETAITIETYDECNTVIDVAGVVKRIRAAGSGFVGLVGVQSNQFPRALDLGRRFRAAGIEVVAGGFHVSGCLSMLPKLPPDLEEAKALGMVLFAGEGEGRMAELLRDVAAKQGKPVYNYLHDLPEMSAAALPLLPKPVVARVAGHYASFDAGGDAHSSAASARSSTFKGASRASARPTTSRRSCVPMRRRGSRGSSSPTTISPATAIGSRSSTG